MTQTPIKTKSISGQNSWPFSSDKVDAAITEVGGQLAPVNFHFPGRSVQPFSIAPWADEKTSGIPPILEALRGDFFCAPFGGNDAPYRGEFHPPHGETANEKWAFESLEKNTFGVTLHLSLETKIRAGRVDKTIHLHQGHTAIYSRHVFTGMSGRMNFGHHAMLKFPDEPGSGRISTSKLKLGLVAPLPLEEPVNRGYSCLKPGSKFTRLDRVALVQGGMTDLSSYPARRGYEDLVQMVHEDSPEFAWTAVAFPSEGYVWMALKDPRVLRSSLIWLSNGGRHFAPWNGRHINVLGMEDVTSYFHYGIKGSCEPNAISQAGFPTFATLSPKRPTAVNYIMAVTEIPRDFDRVKTIIPGAEGVTLVSTGGACVSVPLDLPFLYTK